MSIFCISCGSKGSLEAMPEPLGEDKPLLERGPFDGRGYEYEQEVAILKCGQ
jgi:hypothetical protein